MQTTIQTIQQAIIDTLNGIPAIKEVYNHPLDGNPKKFPAGISFFERFENSFNTTGTNFKLLNFKLFIVINASGTSIKEIYEEHMPKIIDTVVTEFDSKWNGGTINGHRAWSIITGGNVILSTEQKGLTATADLTIQVKVSTDN